MNAFFGRKASSTANTKRTVSRLMMTSALVAAGAFVLSTSAMAAPWDDMTGVGFDKTSGGVNTTNITATTANGKASGTGNLDILAGETVNINAKLFVARDNRDTIQTSILGNLNSNGTVVLVDKNGVVFGKDSRVDVGSLIASTGDVSDALALGDADSPLLFSNFGTDEIINGGSIKASGLVAFVAPTVKNNGVINANLGGVSLAAGGTAATVDLYGDGLVEFTTSPIVSADAKYLSENTGNITGGKIQMTAAAAKNVVDSVVNMQGVLTASSAVVNAKGDIILSAGKVVLGSASVKSPAITGNTKVEATQLDLGLTVDGDISGSAKLVNVLSAKAKISQGLGFVTTNGTVNVAAGTYNEHLVINKDGVTLNGANAGIAGNGVRGAETIIKPNSPGITITADNVTVDGLTFSGATGTDGYGILVKAADNVTLKNNIINNNTQSAIYAIDANNMTILDNSITSMLTKFNGVIWGVGGSNWNISNNYIDSSYYGINLTNVKGDNLIDNNTILNMRVKAVLVKGVENLTISNNTIGSTNGWNNANGIHIYGPDNGAVIINNNTLDRNLIGVFVEGSNNVQILDNTINHSYLDGIRVSNASGTVIDGNNIFWTADKGVRLLGGSNATVQNNIFDTIYGNVIHGIGIDGVTILNNTITNAYARFYGVIHADGGSNWNVSDNNIDGGFEGIKLLDVSGVNLIDDNTVLNMKLKGVYVSGLESVTISDNTIGNTNGTTDSNGIHIDGADMGTTVVSGNILDRNSISILVDNANDVQILDNDISNSYVDGIRTNNASGTVIDGNNISKADYKGVRILGGSDVIVRNNIFDSISSHVIYGVNVAGSTILNNTITNSTMPFDGIIWARGGSNWKITENDINGGYYGINLTNVQGINVIDNNDILNMRVKAVLVKGIEDLTISNNTIGSTNGWNNANGIHIYGPDNGAVIINNNTLDRNLIGVFVEGSNNVQILDNTINHSYLDGIRVSNASGTVIDGNNIFWTADKGVRLLGGSNATVQNNIFDTTFGGAIYGLNIAGANILNNSITNAYAPFNGVIHVGGGSDWNVLDNSIDGGHYGINLTNADGVNVIAGNTIKNMRVEAIHAAGLSNVTISGNTLSNLQFNGIHGENLTGTALIQGNIINNVGDYGIYIEDTGTATAPQVTISGNTILNSVTGDGSGRNGFAAINIGVGQDGYVAISGNTMGNQYEYGLYATSGEIDLTGASNTIQNTDIGMGFYPDGTALPPVLAARVAILAPDFVALGNMLRLTNNTIGTTAFVDQSTAFVDLGLGAFYEPGLPTLLNGLQATYTIGGSTINPTANGGTVTSTQEAYLETMFNHYNDFQDRGLFFFPVEDDLIGGVDQKDIFRLFDPLSTGIGAGSLTITGLPLIAPGATVPTAAPPATTFNPALIEPAAGEESGEAGSQIADIQPSAGEANNSSCWSDATTSLGQGSAVTFNYGAGPAALLQDAVNCGTGATPGQGI